MKYAGILVLLAVALVGAYQLGRSHSELKIVKEQVEVIKYVEKERAAIHSRPNASRAALLELMRASKL